MSLSQRTTRPLRARYGHSAIVSQNDVVFERSGGWWAVSTPRVPGAFSQGRTRSSAYANLLDAISELEKAR